MNGWLWYLLIFYVFAMASTVNQVGQPREPITGAGAVLALALAGFNLWVILHVAGVA